MTIDERIENLERGLTRARRTNAGLLIILCLAVAVIPVSAQAGTISMPRTT